MFRPLGWTPPCSTELHRLIGTILPCSENTPSKAIIQSTTGNQAYIATTGENLDASTKVVLIQGSDAFDKQEAKNAAPEHLIHEPASSQKTDIRTNCSRRGTKTFQPKPTPVPMTTPRRRVLSEWLSPEGVPIHIGDARLKNPEKWRLQRR